MCTLQTDGKNCYTILIKKILFFYPKSWTNFQEIGSFSGCLANLKQELPFVNYVFCTSRHLTLHFTILHVDFMSITAANLFGCPGLCHFLLCRDYCMNMANVALTFWGNVQWPAWCIATVLHGYLSCQLLRASCTEYFSRFSVIIVEQGILQYLSILNDFLWVLYNNIWMMWEEWVSGL